MASRAPEPGKGPKGELRTSIYSAKALIVQGDTFPHREKLLEMGGSFVKGKGVKGFVFSRRVRAKQLDAWLRRMGQPGVPPEALKSVPAGKQESAPKPRAASAGGKKEKKQKRRRVVVEEEEDEEEGGSESDVPKARKRLKRPKQQKEKKQKQRRRREASSSEEEEESSAWDDDSEEEDGSYEGESDSEEELWAEVMGEERGGGGGGKGKGKSKSKAVAARGRGVRVGDVADHILGRMGLGGGGGSISTKKPSKSSSKAKKPSSTKKSGSKKKVPKLGQGDETDFPELLPAVASKATAAAAAARRRQGGVSDANPLGLGGMGAMAALPQELLVLGVAGFLGLLELTRLHMTCKTFTLWLDDARAWAHIPWLDLSYQALAVRRSQRGRTRVQPMDVTMLEVMRIVGQARFRLVQGVDLTGMELGSQRGTHGVAPLLKYVLDHLPAVKRLRLQGPGDSSFRWSGSGVYGAIAEDAGVCAQLEELAVEIDTPSINHLRALLARLPNLKSLRLGGEHSAQPDVEHWERLLAPMDAPLASVEQLVVEQGQKKYLHQGMAPSLIRLFPALKQLIFVSNGPVDEVITFHHKRDQN